MEQLSIYLLRLISEIHPHQVFAIFPHVLTRKGIGEGARSDGGDKWNLTFCVLSEIQYFTFDG